MQYCPAPGIPSSSQQRPALHDPRTSYPTATSKQQIPGIIQFGGVALVDDWFQVQPNRRHVQHGQLSGTQALHPGVQHAHLGQPQHPQAPASYSNPYPPPYPHAQGQPFPSQLSTSLPHPVLPSQPQHQPIRPHGRPIVGLANEYRLATRRQAANGQWPPVNHNRANQLRAPGPSNGINQNQRDEQTLSRTARPGGQFQGPQNGMPSAPQPSFPNPPEALRNMPPHPPGLPIPPAILQKPALPPRFSNQHGSVQGSDARWQIIPGNDEVSRPPLPPTPNVYDVPTPRGPIAPRVDNDRTPRAVVRAGEKTDSSSEARTDTTDTESVVSGFSSSVGSGRATTCTSVTSGSERCTSPPPPADIIVQRSRTPEGKDILDGELQDVVAGYADKYKREGLDALLNELIQNGTRDYRRSLWTAKAARLVFEQLGKDGIPHVERLQPALRFEALRKFRTYWNAAGERSQDDDEQFAQNPYSALPGVNIAGFVGSLFRTSILSADEVHMCLGVLMMNPLQLHSTCAMHALVVHCDGRLCADEHWPGTSRFCTTLKAHSQPVDDVNWDSDDTSVVLVSDILGVIDRWRATVELQTIRDAVDPVTIKTKDDIDSDQPSTKG